MPPNDLDTPEDAKKIRVEVQTSPLIPDNLNDQENRLSPSNNNSKQLDQGSICSQEDENKENHKQSPMSPGTYAARKSSPTPSFATEGNIEKEQNRT